MSNAKVSFNEMFEVITDKKLIKALNMFKGFKIQGFSNEEALAISLAFVVSKGEIPATVALTAKDFEEPGKKQKKIQTKEKRQKKRSQSTLKMMY